MTPTQQRRRRVMWDIVEEHLDEMAFLSEQWERALVSTDHVLAEVAEGKEARLLAHLDGVALAGTEAVERLLQTRLASDQMEEVFAAALALFESPEDTLDWLWTFFEGGSSPPVPVLRAMGLARRAGFGDVLRGLLQKGPPLLQAGALNALAERGEPVGGALSELMRSESPEVKVAVLRAIRDSDAAARTFAELSLESPEPEVHQAALEAGMVLGLPVAMQSARDAVGEQIPGCEPALTALAVGGEAKDVERLLAALDAPQLRASAVRALGFSGWPKAAEACVPLMEDASLARAAGEAFSRVTGLVLEGALVRPDEKASADDPIPLEQEDLDASLVPDPEESLPIPEAVAVARWWKAEQSHFSSKVRYHRGKTLTAEVLWQALGQGPMRGRDVLALELALRTRGAVRIQTRTWAFLQFRALTSGLPSVAGATQARKRPLDGG